MDLLPSLPLAIPLLAAALVMAGHSFLPRRASDALAIAAAGAAAALCLVLLAGGRGAPVPYWFGGWEPRQGAALGIAFVIDPFGVLAAALAAVLGAASLAFSWHFFDSVGTLFHTLVLVFVGAMIGFCLAGDLFTLFVFFELMGIAAYALTGYKIEESPLEGGWNFAVTNSIGAFLFLLGVGLLYGRTGALNLAQIGRALAPGPADPLVLAAFVLLISGLLIKGAVVPFHFWLADAHAVAPTPVCVLFSGIMVELGLYGAARIYWTVFAGVLEPQEPGLRAVFLAAAALTALLGGIMCFLQRHLKRLLAFSSVSHMGVLLAGIFLFEPAALAGAALYLLVHGLVKGGLFIAAGVLLNGWSSVDEFELQGKGKGMPLAGAVFAAGGLLLAACPPFGLSAGKSLIEEAAAGRGHSWISYFLFLSSALTGGAVLRAAGRIFLDWGAEQGDESDGPTEKEGREARGRGKETHWVMLLPGAALMAAALLLGFWPGLAEKAEREARGFQDWKGYGAAVLEGRVPERPGGEEGARRPRPPAGLLSTLGAAGLAVLSLRGEKARKKNRAAARPVSRKLRALHSGRVGDYVAWLAFGCMALGVSVFLVR